MEFIIWIVVGAIAGWLASIIMKTNGQQGLIMDIIIGIAGGFIGGWLLGLLNLNIGGGFIPSVITAVIGAVVLLAVVKFIQGRK